MKMKMKMKKKKKKIFDPRIEVFSPFDKPFSKPQSEITDDNTKIATACSACTACTA
jgi:hypothetical protein